MEMGVTNRWINGPLPLFCMPWENIIVPGFVHCAADFLN